MYIATYNNGWRYRFRYDYKLYQCTFDTPHECRIACFKAMKKLNHESGLEYWSGFEFDEEEKMPMTSKAKRKLPTHDGGKRKKRRRKTKKYQKKEAIHDDDVNFGDGINRSFIVHEDLMIEEVPRGNHEETIQEFLKDHHLDWELDEQCFKNNLERMTVFVPKMKSSDGIWGDDGGIMILGAYVGDNTGKYLTLARTEVEKSYRRRCVSATECHWMGALCRSQEKTLRITTASKACVNMLDKYRETFTKKTTQKKEKKFEEDPNAYFEKKFNFDYKGEPLPKSVVGPDTKKGMELAIMRGKTGMIFPDWTNLKR